MKDYMLENRKVLLKNLFFLLMICAYTVSVSLHTQALFYIMLFVALFLVLLYCHKLDLPAIRAFVFISFYIWVGYDENCYIFEDISVYNRYFYFLITILLGIYLYCSWNNNKNENRKHFLSILLVEFVFWGYAILYKIETGTAPVFETIVLIGIYYIWSTILLDAALCLVEIIVTQIKITNINKQNYHRIWLTIFLILITGGGLFSVLFYPGVISPDTVAIYQAAMNLGDIASRTDIHSFAYTFLEWIIFSICDSFYFLTWIMLIAFSAAWASFMTNICRLGLNRRIVYTVTFIWLLVPSSLYMLISTWKDVPFTVCLMVASNMFMKMSALDGEFMVKGRDYVILAVSLIGAALFRSNGQFVLAVLVIIFLLYALKSQKRAIYRMFLATAAAGITVLLIKVPIYHALQVKGTPESFMLRPFVDGIWENVMYGEQSDLPDNVLAFIEEEISPVDEFRKFYLEGRLYDEYIPNDFDKFTQAKDAWITCLMHNPFVTLMARLKKNYNLWSVFPREKVYLNTGYIQELGDYTDLNYLSVPLFKTVRYVFRIFYSDRWLYGDFCYIIARGGWNIFLWVLFGLFLNKKKMRNRKIIIIPAAANSVAMLIACCYPDYRYTYPMYVLTVLYVLYILQACAMQEDRNGHSTEISVK